MPNLSTITRRTATAALVGGAAAFVAFGPRPRKRSADGRLVLDYWEKWTGHEARAMQDVVDAFNASQDRLLVRYLTTSGIDQKAQIAIAGGDPPDLVGLWNYNIPAFAESGAIISLEEVAHPAQAETYAKPVWQMLRRHGQTWAAPTTCNTTALFYNREAFRKAGLDPDAPPRTIEELDEAAAVLMQFGRNGRVDRAGFLHTEPGWWDWIWGYFFGGSLYDEATNTATCDSASNVLAYEWVQSYPQTYDVSRLLSFQSGFGAYFSTQQSFLDGKVAMSLHGCFLANVIRQFGSRLDYGVAPFPVEASLVDPARPIGMIESDILVIPSGAAAPEASYEFIRFVQQQKWMEHLASVHSKPSPLATLSPGFEASHPDPWVHVHTAQVRSERAFAVPRTRTWMRYRDEYRQAMERIWTLSDTPEHVLADVRRHAQASLDEAALQRQRRAGRG